MVKKKKQYLNWICQWTDNRSNVLNKNNSALLNLWAKRKNLTFTII